MGTDTWLPGEASSRTGAMASYGYECMFGKTLSNICQVIAFLSTLSVSLILVKNMRILTISVIASLMLKGMFSVDFIRH